MKSVLLASALAALAVLGPSAAAPAAAAPPAPGPAAPGPADWRTPDPEDVLVIDTNKGRILVELVPEVAPQFAGRVRELAHQHFYDGLAFFRVIDGFMDQTGDPQNTGAGGSPMPDVPGEFTFRRGPDTPFALALDQTVAEVGFVNGTERSRPGRSTAPAWPARRAPTIPTRPTSSSSRCAPTTRSSRSATPPSAG
jgi:peptidylprolyl isomerase